jgi:hypothetical protein
MDSMDIDESNKTDSQQFKRARFSSSGEISRDLALADLAEENSSLKEKIKQLEKRILEMIENIV